ncbi:hypothetical protein [Massilia sp. TSP1-1-2]|uniref:hypothetical protein n=1 Tax=unclassified Massilia TaxID=2609279 RepID=UPI003CF2E821
MKKTTAANLALILVAVAWPLALFGVFSQMGDPAPDAREQVEAARKWSTAVFFAGALSLIAAIGLAAYALRTAKVRAGIALAAALIPLIVVAGMVMSLFMRY